jgi:hypothetical protein
MRNKQLFWVGMVVLAMSIGSFGQSWGGRDRIHLAGSIHDRSAANVKPAGPWDIHGVWSLTLKGNSGKADFSAALSMEESDYWVLANAKDPNDPSLRNPHTHHVYVVDATVTSLPNGGFRVTGPATITANGVNPPPFGPNSTVQIDITGGGAVPYSNIALTLSGDAAAHFGMQPLDGVVRSSK